MFGPIVKFGKPLLKIGKGLTIVAAATLAAEYGFGKLEDHLNKTGDSFGAAGASIGKSASTIAGLAAAGALIGSTFPVIGTAAGAVVGALVGLALEFNNLKESIPEIVKGWFGRQEPIAAKGSLENVETQRRMQMRMVKSGLELQRTFKKIDQVANTAKNKIYEMQKELSGLKIGNLQDIGGTADGFNSAVQGMRIATQKQYQMQRGEFNKMRGEIASNGKLDADSRRAALQRLNKEELLATQKFVDGVNRIVEALFQTPQIIQAGLKAELSGVMLDFADMGGMGGKETAQIQDEQTQALQDELTGVIDAARKSAEESASMIETLNKQHEASEQRVGQLVDSIARKRDQSERDVLEFEARKAAIAARDKRQRILNPEKTGKLGQAVAASVGNAVGGPVGSIILAEAERRRQEGNQRKELAQAEAEVTAAEADVNVQLERQLTEAKIGERLATAIYKENKKDSKGNVVTGKDGNIEQVTKVDISKANKILDDNQKDQEENEIKIAEAQKELVENMGVSTASMAKDVSKQVGEARKRVENATEEMTKANKSGEGVGEAKSEKEDADKALEGLQSQMDEIKKQLSEKIRKMDSNLNPSAVEAIVGMMTDSSVSLGEMEEELKKHEGLWSAYNAGILANTKAMGKLEGLKAQRAILEQEEDALKSVVEAETGITQIYKNSLKSAKQIAEATRKAIENQRARLTQTDEEMRLAKQGADRAGRVVEVESSMGDGIKAQSEFAEKQVALAEELNKHYVGLAKSYAYGNEVLEKDLIKLVKEREAREAEFAALPEGASEADKQGAKERMNVAQEAEKSVRSQLSSRREFINDARKSANEASAAIGQAGDMIQRSFDALGKSLSGVRLKNFEEYAGVIAESAEYYGDVSKAAEDSFQIAKDVAKQQYALDHEALKEGLAKDKKANEERLRSYMESEAVSLTMDPAEKQVLMDRKKAELDSTTQSKHQLELAKLELKQKKSVVEAARRSKDLKSSEVDIQQGLVDDAMSFASEFGGSFASINALQQMNVGLAHQELDIAKQFRDRVQKTFEEAAGSAEDQAAAGMALMKANADVAAKTLSLRRKELGVQKDIMDRLLGRVFG
jgi:hypothetical protein